MKTSVCTLFLMSVLFSFAQNIDYNTKKGYVAEGYDVVAYFNDEVKKGTKDFMAEHDGAKFIFSSETNLNAFKEDPQKYVPQYGGYCAYAVGSYSGKVDIDPKTYEIRDGKLYLFYNSRGTNTLNLWKKEGAETLKNKADKNWEKIKHKN